VAILITHPQAPDNLAMSLCVSDVMWVAKSHFQLCGDIDVLVTYDIL